MTLKIAHRLALGFGTIVLATLVFGLYQIHSLDRIRDVSLETIERDFAAVRLMRQIGYAQREMRTFTERAWVTHFLVKANASDDQRTVPQQKWSLARERLNSLLGELQGLAAQREQQAASLRRAELWSQIAENVSETKRVADEIAEVVVSGFQAINRDDLAGARGRQDLLDELRGRFTVITAQADDLAVELGANARRDIDDLNASVRRVTIVVLGAILVLGTAIAIVIYRSITRSLGPLLAFVGAIGKGDLSGRTTVTGRDEIGRLGESLNETVGNLAEMTRQTRETSEALNAATAEMQATAQQQAAGASEQSAAVQQITSTLEEITQSGNQISDRSKTVATSAEATATASKSGLAAVSETGRAIESIQEQAERVARTVVVLTEKTQSVGEIIASVNEIAERSNLLALNAAIEAASAGEAGRSFSVVAEEIRNLADQAKDATGQVHGLLSEIQQGINSAVMQTEEAVKRAQYGRERSAQTEQTINELAHGIEQSVATFEQIVAATNQQQIGIEQVSNSVQNIRDASEQIAAGISDLEKAAGSLNAMGSQMRQSIDRYRL